MASKSNEVSVIVPLSKSRRDFFEGYTLPSIKANNPKEIIVINEDGPAPHKRNKGAERATGNYLLFCDDDALLKASCIDTYLDELDRAPDCAFAYSNFILANLTIHLNPPMKNTLYSSIPWDPVSLRERNYIDTASLIRRGDFMGFDEDMPRYQDWEMWLRMAKAGLKGVYVPKILYFMFTIDKSISASMSHADAYKIIDMKHPKQSWPFKDVPRNE